jgi:N-acetylglutamate synthase-like GNAT family acetyltransferase
MQIRIANRQDEKRIQQFLKQSNGQSLEAPQDDSIDPDLVNIEANYFGRDGAFLLAESEGEIVAIAGANKMNEDTFALRRIVVAQAWQRKGLGRRLMHLLEAIADRLFFKSLAFVPPCPVAARQAPESFFRALGFACRNHIQAGTEILFLTRKPKSEISELPLDR